MKSLLVLLFLSTISLAQNCDSIVDDQAGVIKDPAAITQAANELVNQGADVRVRTVGQTSNLDVPEKAYETQCQSWRSADGGRKNTLIVLMVSPAGRKLGIYYGGAWSHALDAHWNRIKVDYMAPRFRDGDYAGGFAAASHQLAERIKASKTESQVGTTIVHQEAPTDFSGLWTFLRWALGLGFLGLLGWVLYTLFDKARARREDEAAAQQSAQQARAAAAAVVSKLSDDLKTQAATGKDVAMQQSALDILQQRYAQLADSTRYDPDVSGGSASFYRNIAAAYDSIRSEANNIGYRATAKAVYQPINYDPPKGAQTATAVNQAEAKPRHVHTHEQPRDTNIFAPVTIVNEPSYAPSSSDSGGSSSWGSSDSGGGSSDWGSSFGGGGSSDFGGGGGGGGSDSF